MIVGAASPIARPADDRGLLPGLLEPKAPASGQPAHLLPPGWPNGAQPTPLSVTTPRLPEGFIGLV